MVSSKHASPRCMLPSSSDLSSDQICACRWQSCPSLYTNTVPVGSDGCVSAPGQSRCELQEPRAPLDGLMLMPALMGSCLRRQWQGRVALYEALCVIGMPAGSPIWVELEQGPTVVGSLTFGPLNQTAFPDLPPYTGSSPGPSSLVHAISCCDITVTIGNSSQPGVLEPCPQSGLH